ncbi:hypothetical protein PybrP1_002054 [[Pythium] brassicae (nom. inval.)]|nr:hypothetical protein PybrP1_002054 [[Pythium] brassicae (nom. inval.)]
MLEDQQTHELRASSGDARGAEQVRFVRDLRMQFRQRRRLELSACAVGFAGVLLMLAQNEALLSDASPATMRAVSRTLQWLISGSTLALVALVGLQFATSTRIARMQSLLLSEAKRAAYGRFRCSVSLRGVRLALELLVCGFHIPPGVTGDVEIAQFHSLVSPDDRCPMNDVYKLERRGNACYLVYKYPIEAFGVFMVLRLYLFARYMRSASTLYSQWVAFIGALNDVNAMRPFFHFKALFKIRPLHLLVPLALLNTLLTAAILRILESPVQAAFENYGKCVWLTAVTLSATGFGDYYPVTYIGRTFTTVSAMFGGLLLVALIQSLFFGVLELSPREQKVKFLIDMDRWEKATHRNAASLLQAAWRRFALERQERPRSHQLARQERRLFELMCASRQLRREQPMLEQSVADHFADVEDAVLQQVDTMEREKQQALARIHQKTAQLDALKRQLDARQRVSRGA